MSLLQLLSRDTSMPDLFIVGVIFLGIQQILATDEAVLGEHHFEDTISSNNAVSPTSEPLTTSAESKLTVATFVRSGVFHIIRAQLPEPCKGRCFFSVLDDGKSHFWLPWVHYPHIDRSLNLTIMSFVL